jgi:hypothetical protein
MSGIHIFKSINWTRLIDLKTVRLWFNYSVRFIKTLQIMLFFSKMLRYHKHFNLHPIIKHCLIEQLNSLKEWVTTTFFCTLNNTHMPKSKINKYCYYELLKLVYFLSLDKKKIMQELFRFV